MNFAEYAALARRLNELHRADQQRTGQADAYRAATRTAIDQLGHRLAGQHQRLVALAQALGEPVPRSEPEPPLPSVPPAQVTGPVSGQPGQPHQPGQSSAGPPTAGGPPAHSPPYPQAHPPLPPGPARSALSLPAAPPSLASPPSPRRAVDASLVAPPATPVPLAPSGPLAPSAPSGPDGPAVDPARELELARRAADTADQEAMRAEAQSGRPPLLPTWSPLARAAAVYAGSAALMLLAQYTVIGVLLVRRLDSFASLAWSFAGLPALAFFGAYLVLNTWGKPRAGGTPSLFPKIGFMICFLAAPLNFCLLFLLRV